MSDSGLSADTLIAALGLLLSFLSVVSGVAELILNRRNGSSELAHRGCTLLLDAQKLGRMDGFEDYAGKIRDMGQWLIESAYIRVIPPMHFEWYLRLRIALAGFYIGAWPSFGVLVDKPELLYVGLVASGSMLIFLLIEIFRLDRAKSICSDMSLVECSPLVRARGVVLLESLFLAFISIMGGFGFFLLPWLSLYFAFFGLMLFMLVALLVSRHFDKKVS